MSYLDYLRWEWKHGFKFRVDMFPFFLLVILIVLIGIFIVSFIDDRGIRWILGSLGFILLVILCLYLQYYFLWIRKRKERMEIEPRHYKDRRRRRRR